MYHHYANKKFAPVKSDLKIDVVWDSHDQIIFSQIHQTQKNGQPQTKNFLTLGVV